MDSIRCLSVFIPESREHGMDSDHGSLSGKKYQNWQNRLQIMYVNSDSSDWLSQSVASSASWYDELEGETTKKLADQLEHLDRVLYSEPVDKHFPHGRNIVNESQQWRQQFPHLRVNGTSIKIATSCQTESVTEETEQVQEEIFAVHGEYNEDYKNNKEVNVTTESELGVGHDNKIIVSDNVDEQEVFKEKLKNAVLEQIFIRIWPNVLKKVEPFLNTIKNDRKYSESVIEGKTNKTEISTDDDDNCEVVSNSLNRLMLTPIASCSVSLPGRLKSVRDYNSNVNRNHTAVFPVKSVVIEPPVSLLSLSTRNTSLKSPARLQPMIKFLSPERMLSPIQVNEVKSAGKKKQSARTTVAERKCTGQSCRSQIHNDSRCGGHRILKTSPPTNMSRHITLPPIETNVQFSAGKVRSTTGKRCVSALWKVEPELRPSTSYGNKSYLSPLDINFRTDTSKPDMIDRHWLDEQSEYTYNNRSKTRLPKQQDQKTKWNTRGTMRK